MKQITINDSIVSYIDFIAELLHEKRTVSFQKKHEAFVSFYDQFKANMDLMNSLRDIHRTKQQISIFYYSEIEEVFACMHLMIEIIANHEINIFTDPDEFQSFALLQDGLARLWQDDTVKNQNYIRLDDPVRISRIHQVDEKDAEELEGIERTNIHNLDKLRASIAMRHIPMQYNEEKHRWDLM